MTSPFPMSRAETLERIDAHQGALSAITSAMLAAVHTGSTLVTGRLDDLRARLVRALREYQLFKHREIFNPAIAAGVPAQVEAAVGMKASCIAAGDSCAQFFRAWSKRDLSTCWDAYVAALHELIAGLRAHLVVERRAIADALVDVEHPDPRD